MTKISVLTELTDGNVAGDDLVAIVDNDASATKRVKASSMYTYYLATLNTASRLVPTLTASATDFLDGTGAFSVPANTTYATMNAGNSYAAGLTPVGSGTTNGEVLLKDGTWLDPFVDLSSTNTITLSFTSQAGVTPPTESAAPNYIDAVISENAASNLAYIQFSGAIAIVIGGTDNKFQLSADLSSLTSLVEGADIDLEFPVVFKCTAQKLTFVAYGS